MTCHGHHQLPKCVFTTEGSSANPVRDHQTCLWFLNQFKDLRWFRWIFDFSGGSGHEHRRSSHPFLYLLYTGVRLSSTSLRRYIRREQTQTMQFLPMRQYMNHAFLPFVFHYKKLTYLFNSASAFKIDVNESQNMYQRPSPILFFTLKLTPV